MKNDAIKPSLGNPARGIAFYPRHREIKQIFRVLESNASIYLSAPRRVGKTSILQFLEDIQEDNGYYFIYTITESVYSVSDFYKVLYETVLKSKAIRKLSKMSKAVTRLLEDAVGYIDEVPGILKIKEQQEPDYRQRFTELLDKFEKGIGRVVIMVDEFPQTLHNIHKTHGADEARKLLQYARETRHYKLAEENVSFIYTGSISLFPMVEKIGMLTDVNDLQPIEVKPLTRTEAADLLSRLCNNGGVIMTPKATDHLLDTIKLFIPFHIQLLYHELENIYEGAALTEIDVQTAIEHTITAKNKARFAPYFTRLKGLLDANEYNYVMEVMAHTAVNSSVDDGVIFDRALKHSVSDQKALIDMLCEDGYLYKENSVFVFTSPILQLWCKKFNSDGI